MTVKIKRTGWLALFVQMASPSMFLSSLFTFKNGGMYNGDKVAIDIQRFGEQVAIAIKKCTGPNLNDIDEFTTKEFTPPAYGEAFPIDVCELLNRMEGVDPYSAAGIEYAAQLMAKMAQGFVLIDDKIKRAIELQASQILQTGQLTLTNDAGDTVYTLDFKPKVAHFPTVTTDWSDAGSDPIADLLALAKTIKANGKIKPTRVIMGESALSNFLSHAGVQEFLDNRRIEGGEIAPQFDNTGAVFYGHVWVGTFRLEIWAYDGTYEDPQTTTVTDYVDADKVIMLGNGVRLDKTSARVPLPIGPDPRVANLLPGRLSDRGESVDVTPNVYTTPNGKQVMGELESRQLLIPVQIDGFGCLLTKQ
jgi:hypothetical protein